MASSSHGVARKVCVDLPATLIKHIISHPKCYIALTIIACLACILVATTGGMTIMGAHAPWAPKFMVSLNTVISSHGKWIAYVVTGTFAGGAATLGTIAIFGIQRICCRHHLGSSSTINTVEKYLKELEEDPNFLQEMQNKKLEDQEDKKNQKKQNNHWDNLINEYRQKNNLIN